MEVLKELGKHWRIVRIPVVAAIALTLLISFVSINYEEHREALEILVTGIWIVIPLYVGWRVADAKGGPVDAAIAGAFYGLLSEAGYYVVLFAGSALGFFGIGLELGLLEYDKLGATVGMLIAIGVVRSAAIATLGLLVALFVIKMKEAE